MIFVRLGLALALLVALGVGPCPAAFAEPIEAGTSVSEVFRDVPSGHWAEKAIDEVAIKRNLMQGYADYSFRGDQPYVREDFAIALMGLVEELEGISKTSWRSPIPEPHRYEDNIDSSVADFVDEYGLFEGLTSGDRFDGKSPVTRFQVAKALNNLLQLGVNKGVLDPLPVDSIPNPFNDLSPSDPYYSEVIALAQGYKVMVGFPDHSFRGREVLTRYQFAATCAQTFPLIRELVQRAAQRKGPLSSLYRRHRPWELALRNGTGDKGFNTALEGNGIRYFDQWFLRGMLRLENESEASLVGGFAFPVFGQGALQPYAGVRLGTYGGLEVGTIAVHPLSDLVALYGDLGMILGGSVRKEAEAGVEYRIGAQAINLGIGWRDSSSEPGVLDLKLGYEF